MVEQQKFADARYGLTKFKRLRRQVEEAQLLQTISLAIRESLDFETALGVALSQVCEATGWGYGEAWLPNTDKSALEFSSAWYGKTPSLQQFKGLSQELTFAPGVGLPGRVWAKQKPEWIQDASQAPERFFLRAGLALEAGLKAGLAIPILARGQVVAVLCFFMFASRCEDHHLVRLVSAVTAQLGAILQLKQAELALSESQRKLTSLINTLPGIVFACHADGTMSYLSEGCLCLTGYSKEALIGPEAIAYHQLIHPDDLPSVVKTIAGAIAQQQPYVAEYRLFTKTGQEKWLWEKGSGVFDGSGAVIGLEGFITDITELKQAEKALRAQEEFLRLVLDNIPQHIFWKDTQSVYLGCNKNWAQSIGFKNPSDVIGKTDYELPCSTTERETYLQQDQRIIATNTPELQVVEAKQRLDGQQAWMEVNKLPIHDADGRVIGLLGMMEDVTERKQAEEALRQAEAKYRSIFENAVEGIFQTTTDGHYLTANPMLATIYGYDSPEELLMMLTDIEHQLYVNPQSRTEFMQLIQQHDAVWGFESQIYRKDGSVIWIAENARTIRDAQGQVVAYEGTVEDITQRKQTEAELYKRESLLQGVAEATRHLLTNPNYEAAIAEALATLGMAAKVDRVYIYENHPHPDTGEIAMSMRFEWTRDAIAPTIQQPHWQNQPYREFGLTRWYDSLSRGLSISGITRELPIAEQELLRRDQILAILLVPILIDGCFWGYIGFDDCTSERCWSKSEESILIAMAASIGGALKREQAAATIRYQAFHDLLTGLPNRICFNNWLQPALTQANSSGQMVAVLFLDLDRFKTINDTLGHAIGDYLLQRVAQRLSSCLREGDVVARWGGDEFTMLLPHIGCPEAAQKIAQRVLAVLKPAFVLEGHELYVTSSIGIALYPQDGQDVPTLLRNADAALYKAKDQGRNNCQFYTAALNSQASELLALESRLHHALERGEFVVYYQPQVDLVTHEIVCLEALVRWQHPELGLLSPNAFIPLAEANGLIVAIGEWVLRTACTQMKVWHQVGSVRSRISVNISARQFQQADLATTVARILKETQLPPEALELEITETTVMQDVEATCAILHDLQQMGVSLAMDDFGTGYSSLGFLKKFPLHTLKIDQSFIQDLPSNPQDAAIVSAVLALGKGLNLNVIAEGVETQAQLERLRSLDCRVIQGHFCSPPLSGVDATLFLQNFWLKFDAAALMREKYHNSEATLEDLPPAPCGSGYALPTNYGIL